jgi:hypothetical protein
MAAPTTHHWHCSQCCRYWAGRGGVGAAEVALGVVSAVLDRPTNVPLNCIDLLTCCPAATPPSPPRPSLSLHLAQEQRAAGRGPAYTAQARADDAKAGGAQLLDALAHLTNLKKLDLTNIMLNNVDNSSGASQPEGAAADQLSPFSALTASSQLESLTLAYTDTNQGDKPIQPLPQGAVAGMFPAGRQLNALTGNAAVLWCCSSSTVWQSVRFMLGGGPLHACTQVRCHLVCKTPRLIQTLSGF